MSQKPCRSTVAVHCPAWIPARRPPDLPRNTSTRRRASSLLHPLLSIVKTLRERYRRTHMPMHNRRQRKNTGSDSCRDEAPERPPFRLLCRFLISLLVLTPGWSWAADIRLSGLSEKGELARITLNGEITAADVARFKDIVGLLKAANVRLTLVELNSRGGMVRGLSL